MLPTDTWEQCKVTEITVTEEGYRFLYLEKVIDALQQKPDRVHAKPKSFIGSRGEFDRLVKGDRVEAVIEKQITRGAFDTSDGGASSSSDPSFIIRNRLSAVKLRRWVKCEVTQMDHPIITVERKDTGATMMASPENFVNGCVPEGGVRVGLRLDCLVGHEYTKLKKWLRLVLDRLIRSYFFVDLLIHSYHT